MIFSFKKYRLFLLIWFGILNLGSSYSMDTEPKSEDIPNKSWSSSANFNFNGKVARDIHKGLDSDKLMEWHMSQALQLADVYSNYQPGAGRNVAKALCSIIYTTEINDSYVNHYSLKKLYINGWRVQDKKVEKNALSRMRLDKNSKGTTELENIFALYEILKNQNKGYINSLIKDKLIIGFNNTDNLFIQTEKYLDETKHQPPFIRDLKDKQTHTEKEILIDIDIHINDIIKEICIPKSCNINYFVINIASYRYMCSSCQRMENRDDPLYNLLMRIRTKVNIALGREKENDINIKVLFSGIAAGKGEKMPDFPSSRAPINLEEDHDRILYLVQNPLRPFSSEEVKDGILTGNMMTVLSVNTNYLVYNGSNW